MSHPDFIRLHFKILSTPETSTQEMLDGLAEVFNTADLGVELGSTESLDLPPLQNEEIDTGDGDIKSGISPKLLMLLEHRLYVGKHDVVIYFVDDLDQGSGFTLHQEDQISVLIERLAGKWTLAHEIGHALKLEHASDPHNLMFENGSDSIVEPPPDLTDDQITKLRKSSLIQHR
jgi:hypothetical protein